MEVLLFMSGIGLFLLVIVVWFGRLEKDKAELKAQELKACLNNANSLLEAAHSDNVKLQLAVQETKEQATRYLEALYEVEEELDCIYENWNIDPEEVENILLEEQH